MDGNEYTGGIHLVVGGRGLIGSALCRRLAAREIPYLGTTRHVPNDKEIHCDLTNLSFEHIRGRIREKTDNFVNVTYLVAAMCKFRDCEGSSTAWHVNVDAPIAIAEERLGFTVFVSSDAVENMGMTSYGRHKTHVESVLLAKGHTAIVRPSRVEPVRADEFADFMIDIGLKGKPGLSRWK